MSGIIPLAVATGCSHIIPLNGKQIIVDVGINFDEEGKMCGDADFEALKGNVEAITPVPGGVGSVTTALLMYHTVMAAQNV